MFVEFMGFFVQLIVFVVFAIAFIVIPIATWFDEFFKNGRSTANEKVCEYFRPMKWSNLKERWNK